MAWGMLNQRRVSRAWLAHLVAVLGTAWLVACGGGGGGEDPLPPLGPGEAERVDATVYSSQPDAALPGAEEAAAVTRHRLLLNGHTLAYTAAAGHVIARHLHTQVPQASLFYVAYGLEGADPATRPITFFYNGGPGSASAWLQLGSFGPRRLATGVPATTATRPFPLQDNADSLLDTTDLVFLNAVGSGRSQALAPFTNRSFWSVDADAELFRDAVLRWRALHARSASPLYLYGESYGGPRTAVLARRLQEAGVNPTGLMLQSPALDYHSNCGVTETPTVSCAAYLPSYAAVGAWHGLTEPAPIDLEVWLVDARTATAERFEPAMNAYLAQGTAAPELAAPLQRLTGLPAARWQARLNQGPTAYRQALLPGQLIGRYDGRMKAATGSALAAEGDPSSTWIGASFAAGIDTHLRNELRYFNDSRYVLLSDAILHWDFSHAGRSLPDTVPDLQTALEHDSQLQVLAINGVHDLATPFHVTERDLQRLGPPQAARVQVLNLPGGHMSFLDDVARPRQKAELVAFYGRTLAARVARAASETRDARKRPQRLPGREPPAVPEQVGDVAAAARLPPAHEAALQQPMRDPWVPKRR